MSFMLKRMFAYFTVLSYLTVGTIAIRMYQPEMKTIEISQSYFNLFSNTEVDSAPQTKIYSPVMKFAKVKLPSSVVTVTKKTAALPLPAPKLRAARPVIHVTKEELRIALKLPAPKLKAVTQVVAIEFKNPTKNELPFHEPVTLSPVHMKTETPVKVVSLYKEFTYQAEMVAAAAAAIPVETKVVEDAVSTKLAAPAKVADVEPEFFEYPVMKENTEIAKPNLDTPVMTEAAPVTDVISPEVAVNERPVIANTAQAEQEDIVAFDYSKAKQDIVQQVIPQVSAVTTQPVKTITETAKAMSTPTKKVTTQQAPVVNALKGLDASALTDAPREEEEKAGFVSSPVNKLTIQVEGTNLKGSRSETGFEVRFQDDQSEIIQDYNTGSVTFEETLATEKMTRSAIVLKRGYAPTNLDLILEEGAPEFSVPLIEEHTFNDLLAPFESRGPIGAVLVELEEGVETAILDVPYSQVVTLDEDMKVTEGKDFSYQLFVGVKAGNALLGYKDGRGDITSKIIHVHEREVTFDANFFEDVSDESVVIKEEDLLSKEKAPLILSAEQVRHFASDKQVKKINDHTYRTAFDKTLIGARKYLELNHQEESIFVGYKNSKSVDIPSENFMRFILSRFEGSKLGDRCLVQINLPKKALDVKVGAESAGGSLMTYTQILDSNGKFFDSVSKKSKKILIVGENQASEEYSKDSKINVKITFEDGSTQFLGSYCSPNTYLVEQL